MRWVRWTVKSFASSSILVFLWSERGQTYVSVEPGTFPQDMLLLLLLKEDG